MAAAAFPLTSSHLPRAPSALSLSLDYTRDLLLFCCLLHIFYPPDAACLLFPAPFVFCSAELPSNFGLILPVVIWGSRRKRVAPRPSRFSLKSPLALFRGLKLLLKISKQKRIELEDKINRHRGGKRNKSHFCRRHWYNGWSGVKPQRSNQRRWSLHSASVIAQPNCHALLRLSRSLFSFSH